MKSIFLTIICIIFFSSIYAQERTLVLINKLDSSKIFLNENYFMKVRLVDGTKLNGEIKIPSDSTILINQKEISINKINEISIRKKGKAVAPIMMGVGIILFKIGFDNLHFNFFGDGNYQPKNSFEKNANSFCASGCTLGLVGSIVCVTKLFNKKLKVKNQEWKMHIINLAKN